MKIFQALKKKNQLIREINKHKDRLHKNNSVEEGNTASYDAREEWKNLQSKTEELIDLKRKISNATQPIFSNILLQGELKNYVTIFKSLNVNEGLDHTRSMYGSGTPIKRTATINAVERDKMIAEFEERIDDLQDGIDGFNAKTDI
jgi:hypothetical protein